MGSDRTPGGAQEALSCRRVSHNSWTVNRADHGLADVVTAGDEQIPIYAVPSSGQ